MAILTFININVNVSKIYYNFQSISLQLVSILVVIIYFACRNVVRTNNSLYAYISVQCILIIHAYINAFADEEYYIYGIS